MPVQLTRRVRTSQPLKPTGLSREWVSRGLVLAIAQNWYATPSGIFPLVRTNSPANLPSSKGRVSGFGTTYAGNTNSYLTGPVLTHPKSGWRSWFVLLYAKSTGGSGFGRVFQHATGTGADGAGGEAILCVGTTNELRYEKFPTLGSALVSEYKTPAAIPLNTWTSYGITHEQAVTDTLPQGYKNGVAETWSILTACGDGSLSSSPPTTLAIGNRTTDTARTWDGMIGIQLYFDGALSAADHAAIHANPWRVFAEETVPLFWSGAAVGRTATASLSAAIRSGQSMTASASAVISVANTATVSASAAIRADHSATASVSAAIRSDRTASASLNAAIQSAATASATLSGAIQTAQSATSGLAAYIVASSARSESAVLSAAISDARTATSSLSAAVAAARTATATLDSAVQIEATASTGVSAAIREAVSLSANLSGAVQASATASASLAAVVAKTNALSSGLSAAVRAEQTAFAALSAYIAADVVLTQAEVDMLTDIWQRFGLDPLAALTETETSASFGGIVLSKSGTNTITSTRSGDSAAGVASSMILDVWQRLGLDPDNPMTASETQISAGPLSQARAVSGATVTVTRAP